MSVVALTGGIASGKSTVCRFFENLGIVVIDADIAARRVVAPGTEGLEAIVKHFGSSVLDTNEDPAVLNRQALREIIFDDISERQWLESCLHPRIRQWMYDETDKASSTYVIHAIPLLIETGLYQQYNQVIVVDVPESVQIERLMSRDNSSEDAAKKILKSQASRSKRNQHATYIIDNNNSLEELEKSVNSLHNQLLLSTIQNK